MNKKINPSFEDFTEHEYRNLLRITKVNWQILPFSASQSKGRICLWRHDIDFSVHRAYKLAQIEAEEQIQSTFFIHLHSHFYNALEDEIINKILGLLSLGHFVGLHFDPNFYALNPNNQSKLISMLKFEKEILKKTLGCKISAFSIHNPDIGNWLTVDQDEIEGMVNTYGTFIKKNYAYCSDSNGYWRFKRLRNVLEDAADEKLHVLTHPEMWTSEAMSPRERVSRCIDGRATKQHHWYDEALKESGRENIR